MDEINKPNTTGNTEPDSTTTPSPMHRSGGTRVINPSSSYMSQQPAQSSVNVGTNYNQDSDSEIDEGFSFRDKPLPTANFREEVAKTKLEPDDIKNRESTLLAIKVIIVVLGAIFIIDGIASMIIIGPHLKANPSLGSGAGISILIGISLLFRKDFIRKIALGLTILLTVLIVLISVAIFVHPTQNLVLSTLKQRDIATFTVPVISSLVINIIAITLLSLKKVKQAFT